MTTPRTDRLDKNYIINGGFDFWQRNTTATLGGSPSYVGPDRFRNELMGSLPTTRTISRSTDVPPNSASKYSALFTVATGVPISNGFISIQRVESVNAHELVVGQKMSLGFWVKPVLHQEVRVTLIYPSVADNYTVTTTFVDTILSVTPNGVWQYVKLEDIAVPAGVSNGLQLNINIQNISSANDTTASLADIKLNIGTKAQEFSRAGRNQAEELLLCLRYYEANNSPNGLSFVSGIETAFPNTNWGTTNSGFPTVGFRVVKRSTPLVTPYDRLGAAGKVTTLAVGGGPTHNQPISHVATCQVSFTVNTAIAGSYAGYQYSWTADAEL